MKKTLLCTVVLLISSFAVFAQTSNKSTTYIQKFKDNAINIMHNTGIPASIILGVAMHESGSGTSNVAQHLNNQFGMKGGGGTYYYKNNKKVRSSYKKYESVMDSFQDFARIMTERKQFSHLSTSLSITDYEGWVKGIARGGYAGSRKWGSQVLAIIKKYNLHLFDSSSQPADTARLAEVVEKK